MEGERQVAETSLLFLALSLVIFPNHTGALPTLPYLATFGGFWHHICPLENDPLRRDPRQSSTTNIDKDDDFDLDPDLDTSSHRRTVDARRIRSGLLVSSHF